MNSKDSFWIFLNLGFGDAIVANGLLRHYAEKYKDRYVILPCWERNLANIQWMLSDVPNIFFYPIETEQQLLTCRDSIQFKDRTCLGFYETCGDIGFKYKMHIPNTPLPESAPKGFNPVLWDSEFYRQAGLDPELKWTGFKLPTLLPLEGRKLTKLNIVHEDFERGFSIKSDLHPVPAYFITKTKTLLESASLLSWADEIHCIDSSMLNLADLMETPHCKRFVFHRYARKGLPPTLKKNWEILD